MRLATLKAKDTEVLTRTFAYPPEAIEEDRFEVVVSYLSPALFNQKTEEAKLKFAGPGRKADAGDFSLSKFRQVMVDEVLSRAVQRVDKLTVRKLQKIVRLDAGQVADFGGLDQSVVANPKMTSADEGAPVDPKTGKAYPTEQVQEAAAANIKWLLGTSIEFQDWVSHVCSTIKYFQDEDWEQQVKNSGSGAGTSSAR